MWAANEIGNEMPVNLLNPVPSSRMKSVSFFNGRLLAGEDLTTEQKTNRIAHSFLGQAIGDGVVEGLEVSISTQLNQVRAPVLKVSQGLAINKNGGILSLENDTDVALVRPSSETNGTSASTTFQACIPVQAGPYIAGACVCLLTIGPATEGQGLAQVSGISTVTAPCNTAYNLQAVQFRLLPINLTQDELNDVNHLRNLIAYKCFGFTKDFNSQTAFVTDPFSTPLTTYGLIEDLRTKQVLTNCEVPLAMLYWTSDAGVVFVDMWSVRRPVIPQSPTETWAPLASRRRMAEGLAMFLQFQSQIDDMVEGGIGGAALTTIVAGDQFNYLPAFGVLPLASPQSPNGFTYSQFFSKCTYPCARTSEGLCTPIFIEGAKVESLFNCSLLYPPINLDSQEAIWLYWVRINMQPQDGDIVVPEVYLVFTNGHVRYEGWAQYDLNYWDYANFV